MRTFRRRPVEVEAIQFTGEPENVAEILAEAGELAAFVNDGVGGHLEIHHPREGRIIADRGDWIVKGGEHEFFPVKRVAFERLYEPCEPV